MTTPTVPAYTGTYRVTSITEAMNGQVTVNFTENATDPNPAQFYGSISQTFSLEDAAQFFPTQIYTMTLTKNA